jgi:hypothetical protein
MSDTRSDGDTSVSKPQRQRPPERQDEAGASTLRGSGVVVRFRLMRSEYQHLVRVSRADEVSLSEAIREALYGQYNIGALDCGSMVAAPRGPTRP